MRRLATPILVLALTLAPILPAMADDAPPSLCEPLLDDPVNSTVVLQLLERGADPREVCSVEETRLVWSGGTHILRDLGRGLGGKPSLGKGIAALALIPLIPIFGIIDGLSALGSGSSTVTSTIDIHPLHLAVQHAEPEVVVALLDAGAPVDQRDGYGMPAVVYAMERALERDEVEPARALFDAGATLEAWDSLDAATVRTISHSPELLALTCAHGLAVDAVGPGELGPALHLAVVEGDGPGVEQLVQCGADLGRERSSGEWPHALAATAGDTAMLDLLIELGADVDERNGPSSPTALGYATTAGDTAAMRLLLDRGADPDVPCWFDTRLLHTAAKENRGDATRLLLEYGAEVDATGDDGETPLLLATRHHCSDCAEALLEHDAALGVWAYEYAETADGPQERVMTRTLLEGGLEPSFRILSNAVLDDQPEHVAFVFEHDDHKAPMYGRLLRLAKKHGVSEETIAVVQAERDARRPGAKRRAAAAAEPSPGAGEAPQIH